MDHLLAKPLDYLRGQQPQLTPAQAAKLLAGIDRIPTLEGVRVGYHDGFAFRELRPHPPICQPNYLTLVVRAVDKGTKEVITNPSQQVRRRDSKIFMELASGMLSCGGAALAWIVFTGSSAAIPFTAGTSSAISVLSFSAGVASSVQCVNSLYRVANEAKPSRRYVNDWLDSQTWYTQTSTALDVISVAGGIASVGSTLKMVITLKQSGTGMREVLKGLSRQQRRQLTHEIIAAQNPNLSRSAVKALISAGAYPKRFGKIELSGTVRLQLYDAIGASLSFTGSATSGVIRSPTRLFDFAVALYEEFEVF